MPNPYGPTLLDHARRPRNKGALPGATVSQDGANPLCGDRVRVQLVLHGDVVTAARFTANACAICTAAASVMTELVKGAPLEDIATLTVEDLLGALKADVPKPRLACVRLPLTVLHTGLHLHERRTAAASGDRP
jgi:nitrogen fixation protein NifU and related proteins